MVYRWAYDDNVPGAPEDFIPQNQPPRTSDMAGRAPMSSVLALPRRSSASSPGWWPSTPAGLMSKPWLEVGVDPRRRPKRAPALPPTGEDRARRIPGRGRRAVHALHQRLVDAGCRCRDWR